METEQLLQQIYDTVEYRNGILYRKDTGKEAGYLDKSTGYRRLSIGNKKYYTHWVIFLMHNKNIPNIVDHVDRNRQNNNIDNLRSVSHRDNIRNSGKIDNASGVCFHKKANKWMAYSPRGIKGKEYLGLFSTHEAAMVARSNYLKGKYATQNA